VNGTVEGYSRDRLEAAVALFRHFVDLLSSIEPFQYSLSKTTIAFKGSRRGSAEHVTVPQPEYFTGSTNVTLKC
jgi:hypothetical protein